MTNDARNGKTPMLALENVQVYYGNIAAVKGLSFTVMPGEIVTLLGSNGAGKSTTLRTIAGLLRPRRGAIFFEGARLDGVPAHEVVARGIAQSPEGRRIFPRMSVDENLDLGAYARGRARRGHNRSRVFSIFPRLAERQRQRAGTLSGGEQQMLAIGRGLMAEPRLLILDEPSLGLSPLLVEELFSLIGSIHAEGIAILLVEQNVVQSLEVASRAYILDNGVFVLQGAAAEIRDNPDLKRAYLGM